MGIDELKQLRDNFLERKQNTEESYAKYVSFDADSRSSKILSKFRKKYNIAFLIYVAVCIISIVVSFIGFSSTSWLVSVLSSLFVGGSITTAVICRARSTKICELDYQTKKDLYGEYLKNHELCQEITKQINNVLNELDEETKANNQDLIDSCIKETMDYCDYSNVDISSYIEFAFFNLLCSYVGGNDCEEEEVVSSVEESEIEELPSSEESEPIEQGVTRKLN